MSAFLFPRRGYLGVLAAAFWAAPWLAAQAQPDTQILVMSNGGFGGIHQRLLAALESA